MCCYDDAKERERRWLFSSGLGKLLTSLLNLYNGTYAACQNNDYLLLPTTTFLLGMFVMTGRRHRALDEGEWYMTQHKGLRKRIERTHRTFQQLTPWHPNPPFHPIYPPLCTISKTKPTSSTLPIITLVRGIFYRYPQGISCNSSSPSSQASSPQSGHNWLQWSGAMSPARYRELRAGQLQLYASAASHTGHAGVPAPAASTCSEMHCACMKCPQGRRNRVCCSVQCRHIWQYPILWKNFIDATRAHRSMTLATRAASMTPGTGEERWVGILESRFLEGEEKNRQRWIERICSDWKVFE